MRDESGSCLMMDYNISVAVSLRSASRNGPSWTGIPSWWPDHWPIPSNTQNDLERF
jgi:hypothetical protein